MNQRYYINLTNGIEWLPQLAGLPVQFVRIESTAIEHGDWLRILRDLNADLLLHLALGYTCHVYDCGCQRSMGKVISQGIPYIRDTLVRTWICHEPPPAPDCESQAVKRRLNYFRRFLATDDVQLIGHSFATERGGDVAFYRSLLLAKEASHVGQHAQKEVPSLQAMADLSRAT